MFKLVPSDVGRQIGDFKPNFDLDLDALISEVTKTLNPQEKEIKDRQGRWIRLQIRPYKTIDNRIDGAVIALVDIEALKQSLDVSEAALKYATSVADTVQLPFVVLDPELRVKSANLSFYEYFNISPQTVGISLFDILGIRQEAFPKLTETMKETLTTNTPFKRFELDHESKTLGPRKLLLSGRQIHWAGTESQALLLALEDFTERKQTADNLREALRSREEFLSIASHELKTPVSTLKLQLQMLRRAVIPDKGLAPSPEKLAKALDISTRQVERITALIDDLLDVSRVESGKMTYSFEPVDVAALVNEVIEPFTEKFKSARSPLEVAATESITITCDRFRIEQVVTNLVTNAIKYGAGSPIQVKVSASTNRGVKVCVSDRGMGIAKDKQAKIFERFERAISHANISGLGLGLYISKQIVDAHGGTIELESELGKGSKFTVELPNTPPSSTRCVTLKCGKS